MSERNNDRSGRWRNTTIAFRMSEEEAAQLDILVSISGLTKQDYITSKLLNREVRVIPSSRIQINLQSTMRQLLDKPSAKEPLLHLTADEAFRTAYALDSKGTEANIGGDAE